jgi:catechol 2,3-dioxygenase-like lactoylglutathione lyase family enzyme
MLLDGFDHVAILTKDADRLHAFYREVFDAVVRREGVARSGEQPMLLSNISVGPHSELSVFQITGNTEADHQTPMFGRGRIDHIALHAASLEAFETIRDRLIARRAADDFVADFGPTLSLNFCDPDGLQCELRVPNPDAQPGVSNPPGTPAARYMKSAETSA